MDFHVEVNALETPTDVVEGAIREKLFDQICGFGGFIELVFAARGYPGAWAPLKASTVRDKIRKGYAPIADQTRTGKLQWDARHPTVTGDYASMTFTIDPGVNPYAAAHQYGSMGTQRRQLNAWLAATARRLKPSKKPVSIGAQMPPRPPLPAPSEEYCQHIAQELGDMLMKLEGF